MMSTIFTKIINRQVPAHILAEDEQFIAFLDINPLVPGHTLVVPKQEVDDCFDLHESLLSNLLPFAKRVAIGLKKAVPCARVGMAVVGLEIPHAHLHLLPIQQAKDINFTNKPLCYTQADLAKVAQQIREHMA